MLFLFTLLASTSIFGQHFANYPSNAEYGQNGGVRQYKVTDGAQYSTTDPAVNMTMNTLAANGYGQWTVSTNLGNNVVISGHEWLFSPNQSGTGLGGSWSPNGSSTLCANLDGIWRSEDRKTGEGIMSTLYYLTLLWLPLNINGSHIDIGNVDDNFWDNGTAGVNPFTSSGIKPAAITIAGSTFRTSMTDWPGSISCGGSLNQKDPDDNQLLAMYQPSDDDTCSRLKQWLHVDVFSKEEAKLKYDTLRMYIERCAVSDSESFKAFVPMDGAVARYAPNDTTRYDRYREWLISVLYLNTTAPFYFCACLLSIAGTYQYDDKYHPTIAALAVFDYIRKQKQCYAPLLDSMFVMDSLYASGHGLDPANLPPLDSLGLGFLLKAGVTDSDPLARTYLGSFTANPNPFRDELSLNFQLNRTSYVSIQLFDLLGRMVWESKGRTFNEGAHELLVDARSLTQGTLYARITTGFGEVKTVKLVKE